MTEETKKGPGYIVKVGGGFLAVCIAVALFAPTPKKDAADLTPLPPAAPTPVKANGAPAIPDPAPAPAAPVAPAPAAVAPVAPRRTALGMLESDYRYNEAATEDLCRESWEKRGKLDRQMFRHCVKSERDGHKDLVRLVKKQAELKWIDALLPAIWDDWTKRGRTQYQMVHYGLNGEVEAYLNIQYERQEPAYNASEMTSCVAQWQRHSSPWSMGMHCYKQTQE